MLGHALVRDEHGEEMHKSKGNSIPFDEAADHIGADTMRWMFASANPAINVNFGYGPGADVVRRFFLPLWNTYAFFANYARLDGWTPSASTDAQASPALLDRWILSRLDALVGDVRAGLDAYDTASVAHAIEAFVDELSNWYVRRSRRRFWKGELDADKRAAYTTLHEVLAALARLLAPFVPHLADAMWRNLVVAVDDQAPDSVHLAAFPSRVAGRHDAALDQAVALARRVVGLGHTARAVSKVRTRQPLRAVHVKLPAAAGGALAPDAATAEALRSQVLDELNVKSLELIPDESEMVERTLYPLLPVIGPRHGSAVGAVMAGARSGDWRLLGDGRAEVGGVTLGPDEFQLTARARPGHEVAEEGDLLVALDTELDDALSHEGLARELAHRLQNLRKAAGYEISDRIEVAIAADAPTVRRLQPFRDWLAAETLATSLELAPEAELRAPDRVEDVAFGGAELRIAVRRH